MSGVRYTSKLFESFDHVVIVLRTDLDDVTVSHAAVYAVYHAGIFIRISYIPGATSRAYIPILDVILVSILTHCKGFEDNKSHVDEMTTSCTTHHSLYILLLIGGRIVVALPYSSVHMILDDSSLILDSVFDSKRSAGSTPDAMILYTHDASPANTKLPSARVNVIPLHHPLFEMIIVIPDIGASVIL